MSATTLSVRMSAILVVLSVLAPTHLPVPTSLEAQEPESTATVVARVTDPTGQPMGLAAVEAIVAGRPVARGETSPDGLVRLSVPAGSVALRASWAS